MKYLFVSDIHGSLTALQKILHIFDTQQCDMLCLGGDLLNYGPRNGLPEGLDPMAIAEELNKRADRIIAVRGNCDSEVDQMLLEFPMLGDYALIVDNGVRLLLTHGHLCDDAPWMTGVDVVVKGHTHLCHITWNIGVNQLECNLGSPTFPKGGNKPTYAIWENGCMKLFTLDGELLAEHTLSAAPSIDI